MAWQRRARVGVAVFIIAFGVVVYLSIGQRRAVAPPARVERQDPSASFESTGGLFESLTKLKENYKFSYDTTFTYPDGSSKFVRIRIETNRNGRDFVISANEASSGPNDRVLALSGDVRLAASDGFSLQTASATFNRDDGVARAPGPVTFSRGGMSGSGVGMTYDERNDVLTITDDSKVTMTGEEGTVTMDFAAGASTLDRLKNTLNLDGGVHVVRGEEAFDADRALARLTDNEEIVTFIELRGNARVAGGSSLDSMSARDIDLDYTDDGEILERITMIGDAAVAIPSSSGNAGREIHGGSLDLTLAPDGALTRAIGANGVRLSLPSGAAVPARTITARSLDGGGEPGRGLTSARFTDSVEYREGSGEAIAREARSRGLLVALDGDAVSNATFSGSVTFRDGSLQARAAEAGYAPASGEIHLTGFEEGRPPNVTDDQITIDAASIDVAFESRRMKASGNVRTTLRSAAAEPAGRGRRAPSKLPGLLNADQAVTITSVSLDYGGSAGDVIYTGNAVLRQGPETFIRAARLVIDQEGGDLTATGDARATLIDKSGTTEGSADEIRYTDAKRLIAYRSKAPGMSRVKGPQGDLRARTIDVTLAAKGSELSRLDASTLVTIELDLRKITGDRLEYDAAGGDYVVFGGPGRPMTIIDRSAGACKPYSGTKLTFSRATDNIRIEGQDQFGKVGSGEGCAGATPSAPASPTRTPAPRR